MTDKKILVVGDEKDLRDALQVVLTDAGFVLSVLRKDTWGKDVPVLLLTNSDDPANITQGFEHKSNDYIIKSNMSLEEIVKRMKQYLADYHDWNPVQNLSHKI